MPEDILNYKQALQKDDMEKSSHVVVFPTVFARNKMPQIMANIRKILDVEGQQYRTIRRDGDIIVVDANDPVFASSAIGLLFGVKMVAIAWRINNDFDAITSEIADTGGNLLLKGETFLVRADGTSKGFLAKDVEIAAASKIIEKSGAKPGTEQKHDKLLYTHMTRKNAYVCIFSDDGPGGVPLDDDKMDAICCIHDELSAVSCYEAIKQGLNPKIIVCYRKKSDLVGIAKTVNQIIPRLLRETVTIEVFHIKAARRGDLQVPGIALDIAIGRAKSCNIPRVAIPASPLMFPKEFIDYAIMRVARGKKIPVLPLYGVDSAIFDDMKQMGATRHISKVTKVYRYENTAVSGDDVRAAAKSRQDVEIRTGVNNIHDFLDSIDIRI